MRIFFVAIACILSVSFSQAQVNLNTDLPQDVSFQQLNKIASLSKPVRDSISAILRKIDFSKMKMNNDDDGTKLSASTKSKLKSVVKDMYSLLLDVFENPSLADKAQLKMDALSMKTEILGDQISYEMEKKSIIDEYKNTVYDSKEEKREARKEMKEQLKDLEKEHKEDLKEKKADMAERLKD